MLGSEVQTALPAQPTQRVPKSFTATWLFSLVLGWLGIDRFYLERMLAWIGTGVFVVVSSMGSAFGHWQGTMR